MDFGREDSVNDRLDTVPIDENAMNTTLKKMNTDASIELSEVSEDREREKQE